MAACLRSADALGVGEVDVLRLLPQKETSFHASRAACGSAHWLQIREFTQELPVYKEFLNAKGSLLVAAVPEAPGQQVMALDALPAWAWGSHRSTQKAVATPPSLTVLFGNEHAGVHGKLRPYVDGYMQIPTCGFVESMNVSVATAITLHHLTWQGRALLGSGYFLGPDERQDTLNHWIKQTIPRWREIYRGLAQKPAQKSATKTAQKTR